MGAQGDDLMTITIRVDYPDWMDELSAEEFSNTLRSARHKAINAVLVELDKAERFWKERKRESLEGQMDIYDYV